MGVFSASKCEQRTVGERPRRARVRPTEGMVRDVWQAAPYSARAGGSPVTPVRGVTLEMFAEISRAVAGSRDPHGRGIEIAHTLGVTPPDWRFASRVWTDRIAENPALGRHLSALAADTVTLAS